MYSAPDVRDLTHNALIDKGVMVKYLTFLMEYCTNRRFKMDKSEPPKSDKDNL